MNELVDELVYELAGKRRGLHHNLTRILMPQFAGKIDDIAHPTFMLDTI